MWKGVPARYTDLGVLIRSEVMQAGGREIAQTTKCFWGNNPPHSSTRISVWPMQNVLLHVLHYVFRLPHAWLDWNSSWDCLGSDVAWCSLSLQAEITQHAAKLSYSVAVCAREFRQVHYWCHQANANVQPAPLSRLKLMHVVSSIFFHGKLISLILLSPYLHTGFLFYTWIKWSYSGDWKNHWPLWRPEVWVYLGAVIAMWDQGAGNSMELVWEEFYKNCMHTYIEKSCHLSTLGDDCMQLQFLLSPH